MKNRNSIYKNTFLDFDIDLSGMSLTDRCLFESNFDDCVYYSRYDKKILKYLYDKCKKCQYNQVTFSRYESIKIMIWQNVIEKIELKKRPSIKDDTFFGYYITSGGYIFSTQSFKLKSYNLSDGKRYYYLADSTKKVYDENKREWVL
jgi:hypothetical protein